MAKIKIDDKALKRVVRDALEQRQSELQRVADRVYDTTAGWPVEQVKDKLVWEWKSALGAKPDPHLADGWAAAIAEGRRVKVVLEG